jgi:uncharacterized damage-inducible protein DinB
MKGGTVKLTELFVADMEREREKTRKAVEAVPEGKGDWKPHDKAMPFGRLAGLVAQMPTWISMMVDQDEFDVAPATPQTSQFSQQPKTQAELAKTVEDGFAGARKALETTTDDHLMKTWRLKARGNVVMEAPRHVMLRDALMHLAHHRGQLTTYIRIAGGKVPSIYGPTADEPSF